MVTSQHMPPVKCIGCNVQEPVPDGPSSDEHRHLYIYILCRYCTNLPPAFKEASLCRTLQLVELMTLGVREVLTELGRCCLWSQTTHTHTRTHTHTHAHTRTHTHTHAHTRAHTRTLPVSHAALSLSQPILPLPFIATETFCIVHHRTLKNRTHTYVRTHSHTHTHTRCTYKTCMCSHDTTHGRIDNVLIASRVHWH